MTEASPASPPAAPDAAPAQVVDKPVNSPDRSASDDALVVRNVKHAFKQHQALVNVDFTVPAQTIHGFVGPNGAGKTTTLKLIATLLPPQTGEIRVFGLDVRQHVRKVRQMIGFMPDYFSVYNKMTVFEYLDFFGAAYGQGPVQRRQTIDDVLALTDMEGRRDATIKGLSRGMQQRVGLARVLINDPRLLLLDEPASGLDPRARIELMEILRELRRLGKTIFISSHILSELAELCDTVTILDRGVVKYTGTMDGLLSHGEDHAGYVVELATAHDQAVNALRDLDGVHEVKADADRPRYVITYDATLLDTNALLRVLIEHGAPITSFEPSRKHLNQAFMDLTEAGVRS